jgi:hypothetical protein
MKHTGPTYREKELWFPPLLSLPGDSLTAQLAELERLTLEAVLAGKMPVLNLHLLGIEEEMTSKLIRTGVVPLRWGAPRLLLLTPQQGRDTDDGQELARCWRLWRYSFDPKCDPRVIGSPNRAEKLIRKNVSEGLEWWTGIEFREVIPG